MNEWPVSAGEETMSLSTDTNVRMCARRDESREEKRQEETREERIEEAKEQQIACINGTCILNVHTNELKGERERVNRQASESKRRKEIKKGRERKRRERAPEEVTFARE